MDLLRPQLDRPFAWIPLGRVREGGSPLAARLVRLAGMVIVADAETDADLDTLIEAVLELDAPPLLVGSAGLALALARRLGLAAARVDPPPGERWLIVAGSQHPATRRQVEAAREAGLMVLATPDAPQADRAGAVAELAAQSQNKVPFAVASLDKPIAEPKKPTFEHFFAVPSPLPAAALVALLMSQTPVRCPVATESSAETLPPPCDSVPTRRL